MDSTYPEQMMESYMCAECRRVCADVCSWSAFGLLGIGSARESAAMDKAMKLPFKCRLRHRIYDWVTAQRAREFICGEVYRSGAGNA